MVEHAEARAADGHFETPVRVPASTKASGAAGPVHDELGLGADDERAWRGRHANDRMMHSSGPKL